MGFDLCVSKWVDVDNLWITAQAGFQCLGANDTHVPCDTLPPKQGLRRLQGGRINASKTSLYLKGVEVVIRDWIRYIADVREVRENSPFDTYLYGSYHNAFSSFENIWDKVYFSFAVCMAVVFVVITVSITVQVRERCGDNTIPMAVCTSIITCAFMSMAFFCTVSTLSLLDLPMMPPTMVIILLTLGIAVEVMGHIGQEYVKTKGSRSYKARTALMNLWWPLGNGLVTTILAVSIFFAAKWYFLSDMINYPRVTVRHPLHGLAGIPCRPFRFWPTLLWSWWKRQGRRSLICCLCFSYLVIPIDNVFSMDDIIRFFKTALSTPDFTLHPCV